MALAQLAPPPVFQGTIEEPKNLEEPRTDGHRWTQSELSRKTTGPLDTVRVHHVQLHPHSLWKYVEQQR